MVAGQASQEDIKNYWMGHKPKDMSGIYSHLHEETEMRLEEADHVGYGFDLPNTDIAPNVPRKMGVKSAAEVAA